MSEEKSAPAEKKPARSATTYLIVLFLAALLLLALSFFMQQRQALIDLNDTVAAGRDITELQLANQQLEFQIQENERQLKESEKALQAAQAEAETARQEAQALEWLRQLEAAVRSSYPKARELAEAFEATGLKGFLPKESAVEGGTSPAETYENIYNMLFD